MTIDIRTLALVLGITHVVQLIVFTLQASINRTYRGIEWWLLWSVSAAAGFVFLLLRTIPGIEQVAIIAQNGFLVLGTLFLYIGLMRFLGKKESLGLISSFFAVFVLALAYFDYVDNEIVVRTAIISIALAATSLLSAHALLAHKTSSIRVAASFLTVVFLAHAAVFLHRAALVVFGAASVGEVFRPTLFNVLPYLDGILASLLWTSGLIIMVNQRSNAEMREARDRFELLFQTSPDAVLITRTEDGLCREVNEGFVALSGFGRSEVIGRSTIDLNLWSDHVSRERVVEELRKRGRCDNAEMEFRRKDGTWITGILSARPLSLDGVPHVMSVIRDITERRRTEEALAHSQAQLVQSQKLEAVGRLAGGVAHDFNNIMQAMLSLATVLRLKVGTPELARIVGEIEAHVKRGAGLTQQLLLFSRRQSAEKTRLDLGELTDAAGVLLRRLIPENIRLSVDPQPQRLWVDGDAGQLQQVFVNLAANARDAMPGGGALTIRTSARAGEAVVEIVDTGHGMDGDTRARLFEPFFTTKETAKGTGLGLSVVHGIVEQHGGRVEVESAPAHGSCFRVILPSAPAPAPCEAPGAPSAEAELPPGNGERVLVVEDEDGAREGLTELLTILGYEVVAVDSGEAAEAIPAEQAPDLLLTDLMLPGIDGATLAARLRGRWTHLRVVLMSGYTEDEAVRRGVDEGSVRFLQKPFDMAALARALSAALAVTAHGEGVRP